MGHDHTDELRDSFIIEQTEKYRISIEQSLAAGDPEILLDAANAWTSTLESNDIATALVRAVYAADAATAGQELRRQIDVIVADMAEVSAVKEAELLEAEGKKANAEAHFDRVMQNIQMARNEAVAP